VLPENNLCGMERDAMMCLDLAGASRKKPCFEGNNNNMDGMMPWVARFS
jgi:hypothetical protein